MWQEDRKVRPLLKSFRIRAFRCETSLEESVQLQLKIDREVLVGLLENLENSKEPLTAHVKVILQGVFEDSDGSPNGKIDILGTYEAKFSFHKDVTRADIEPLMDDESYQYLFVSQAHVLASRHFSEQLSLLGFSTGRIPLGIM